MNTPVLLLVYNRPEQTFRVLQRLKDCGAKTVFVSGDGPKSKDDRIKTDEVKSSINRFSSIISNVQFLEHNQGCKKAVITGINWFFDNVEEGIILEDDCLPSEHFFSFANNLLNRYRNDRKVWMISGNNPLGIWETEGNHFFSRIGHIWGWATWRDRWDDFRPELPYIQSFIDDNGFEKAFGPTQLAESRKQLTLKSKRGEIDTWDYQWMAQILTENGVAVIPSENLVENIGFTDDGTNITQKPNWIQNEVATKPLHVSERSIVIDREYEMQLELTKRANQAPNPSSEYFSRKGISDTRKLRILLINSTDVGGGAEKLALMLHCRLEQLGHTVKFLVKTKKTDLDSVCKAEVDWKRQIREFNPDVIHVHNLHDSSIELSELSEISRSIPILWTLHDTWLITGSNDHAFEPYPTQLSLLDLKNWKKEFELRQLAISSGNFQFSAPSQWMRERFYNAHQIVPFYVPNAVESVKPTSIEPPSNRFILFVANRPHTNPYKDFDTLKKGWIKANKKLGLDGMDLICLGGNPVTEKHGKHRLIILEKQTPEEVRAFMEKSLFVVQISKQDNAPLAVLEAHSAGKKVVASLDGGIPELLDQVETGWLHEPENEIDLSDKLVDAIRSVKDEKPVIHSSFKSVVETYLGHYLEMVNA